MNSPYPVKKGEVVELTVERIAVGGKGVARIDGYAVFVPRGLPGQRVRAMIIKRKRSFAEARVEAVLAPGHDEVAPRCSHTGTCGGCTWQHLDTARQLEVKRDHVIDCLERIGGLDVEVEPTVASPLPFEYRNKMEFTFSTRWLEAAELAEDTTPDRFGAGLHIRGRFDRVVNIGRCHLFPPWGSEVLERVRTVARESGLSHYSTRTHTGFWRFLVIRDAVHTGQRMVHLITNEAPGGSDEAEAVARVARELEPFGVTSLLHGVSTRKASIAVAESTRVLAGAPVIQETLLGERYEIGPATFFQTNTLGAERLFREVLERGRFTRDETVWDLYCGAGAISLPLARRVRRVVGVEVVEEATTAAVRNAGANGIGNVEFHTGDIRHLVGDLPVPDAVVVDPPRDGVHPDVLATIADRAPDRIVYVSCNPATLARDLAVLAPHGYRARSVLPVDLFPHTAHVECVTVLERAPVDSPGPR